MTQMRAVDAMALILEKEGITQAFGVPGAAINPFYSALKGHGGFNHVLARHVEAASHMAEGFTRAAPGNIGLCIGTSGPGGTDMVTGLYSAWADSIPILCVTGQAPIAKLDKEDFQAVDIVSIAAPVTKWAVMLGAAAQLPGTLRKACQLMREGRKGPVLIDLPIDVQMTEIDFDIDLYEPAEIAKPAPSAAQIDRLVDLINQSERPVIVAGGGIINATAEAELLAFADARRIPVIPTLMGWGCIPDDHDLMAGMVGLQTSHRCGNATLLRADLVIGIGNRWANRHTGDLETYTRGRKFVHVDVEATQIGRIFEPTLGIVSDAKQALVQFVAALPRITQRFDRWSAECLHRKHHMLRKTDFEQVPMKPQRIYQAMNEAFGPDTRYVSTIGLSQIAGGQFLKVFKPRHWINCGQAGPLGWTLPAALGVSAACPDEVVVGVCGDYDFQFLIEELAVGAQHGLGVVIILLNNAYLGLIRQAQKGFDMDFQVSLAFDNQNTPAGGDGVPQAYGVDHAKVIEGMGCEVIRVLEPQHLNQGLIDAQARAKAQRVPVVVECICERVTNIAMGQSIAAINEFEPIDCRDGDLTAETFWVPKMEKIDA